MVTQSGNPTPPRDGAANTPVNKAPTIPPTPWTPKTSNESSAPNMRFRPFTPHKQMIPASNPMTTPPIGPTNPHAGVMATRPDTAPDAAPNIDGLPLLIHSPKVHAMVAAAVASNVFMKANAAPPLASKFDPALKPNQPTHSSDAPIIVIVSE